MSVISYTGAYLLLYDRLSFNKSTLNYLNSDML